MLVKGLKSALSQASFRMPQLYAGTKHSKSFKKEKKSKQQTLSSHLHHKNAKLPIWPTEKNAFPGGTVLSHQRTHTRCTVQI